MTLYTSSLFRWLERKRYQYEVTFSLYMLSPTEKFIFNSVIFLVLSMIIIAAALYLPEHISLIARRASFYWGGEEATAALDQMAARAASATAAAVRAASEMANARLKDQGERDGLRKVAEL